MDELRKLRSLGVSTAQSGLHCRRNFVRYRRICLVSAGPENFTSCTYLDRRGLDGVPHVVPKTWLLWAVGVALSCWIYVKWN